MGVLDDMTRGITDRKAAAAGSTLTPVGLEASSTKPSLAALPNDLPGRFMSSEDLGLAAASLREHAATLIATADSIDQLIETTARRGPVADPKAEAAAAKVAEEKAADKRIAKAKAKVEEANETAESFADRQKRLAEEAQAAVFMAADDTVGEPSVGNPNTPEVSASGGWQCPEHGDDSLEQLTSRLRPAGYMACTEAGCGEFEPKG